MLKKFWKLYPKSKNRRKISLNRLRISPKIRKKIMKFGKIISTVKEIMDMEDIIIIKNFLEK